MGTMKKQKRQTRVQKRNLEKKLVAKANAVENPLTALNDFQEYTTKDNEIVKLSFVKTSNASAECKAWILDIMDRNMRTFYERCEWGWDPVAKEEELTEPEALYLLASLNETFVGFSHFRFDIDDNDAVLYCYELQLEAAIRRKGLGKYMMKALETMALESKMQRVVLTVLKSNPEAVQFFSNMG